MRDEAAQWLQLSRTDLRTARHLARDEIFYASVFFAQQAAEKALKALWIARQGELAPKTHNLVALADVHLNAARVVVDWSAAQLEEEA